MAYNKARAEKEWLEWKNDEETKRRLFFRTFPNWLLSDDPIK